MSTLQSRGPRTALANDYVYGMDNAGLNEGRILVSQLLSLGADPVDLADLVTLSGVAVNSTDLATFTGDIIPDASNTKEALQAIETAIENAHVSFQVNPTINNDSSDGYILGTVWVNVTDDTVFVLVDSTVGSAVWINAGGITHASAARGNDNNQVGTEYLLVITDDENVTVWMNNAASNILTIPSDLSTEFPDGTKINVMQEGVGVTTIQAASGVVINGTANGSAVINNQFSGAVLSKRTGNIWIVTGDIT